MLLLTTGAMAQGRQIDEAYLKCQYQFTEVTDTLDMSNIESDLMILQIGKKVSKFYSYYTAQYDSLAAAPNHLQTWGALFSKGYQTNDFPYRRTTTFIYKNYPKGKITVTDNISLEDFIYVEEFKPQMWQLLDSTQKMMGYTCQEASCHFRGRTYYAWFTMQIPVRDGPWKFSGLPGLIMAVSDADKTYRFELTGIEKREEPIFFSPGQSQSKKYIRTDRKKFLKAYRRYLENINGYIRMETQIDLGDSHRKVLHRDLMERDY